RRCERQMRLWEAMRAAMEADAPLRMKRSHEYGSRIIHSLETGQPRTINGNVSNGCGLIANLPTDCCVEVPCLVDERGIHPQVVGALPPQLAALIQTNVNVQALPVEAA